MFPCRDLISSCWRESQKTGPTSQVSAAHSQIIQCFLIACCLEMTIWRRVPFLHLKLFDMNLSETHAYRGSVCRKIDLLLLPLVVLVVLLAVVLVVLLAVVLVGVVVAVIMIVMIIYNSNDEYERYHYNCCCCCHYYCYPYCTATATDDVLRENIISQNIPRATISQEYIKWKPHESPNTVDGRNAAPPEVYKTL